jgi:hypothetical protein
MSWLSRSGCHVLAVMYWLSCPCFHVLAVMSWLSCPGCPVLAFISWLSCLGCHVLAVMSWLLCPGRHVLDVPALLRLSCSSWDRPVINCYCCPLQAVLFNHGFYEGSKFTGIPFSEELAEVLPEQETTL